MRYSIREGGVENADGVWSISYAYSVFRNVEDDSGEYDDGPSSPPYDH